MLRVIPRENRADSCNVGYIDVPDFAQSNFYGEIGPSLTQKAIGVGKNFEHLRKL
jgi:hypothetical protein